MRSRNLRSSFVGTAFVHLLIVGILFLNGCDRKTDAPRKVKFFFTSHTHGRLTQCGCFSGQFGGLARLRTALTQPRLHGAIGVDVGDAIEGFEDFHELKYKQIVHAYGEMGYAAMNVGHREATLSATRLRALAAGSEVPLISANLLDRSTGKPLLNGWRIIQKDGLRIALAGVVDPQGVDGDLGEGLAIEPMESCLSRILPELKRSADFLVLLAFTDEARLNALASQFYEFSLILGGRVSQPAQQLVRVNQSLVYYTANESKSFGALEVSVSPGKKREALWNEIQLLNDRFPEDENVLKQVTYYRDEVRRTKLTLDDPASASANHVSGTRTHSQYAGSESCLDCHATAAAVWKKSGHSHAFSSLVNVKADADPSCIGCHTIGFQMPAGYRREFGSSKLVNVGCESCHGPGATHVAERTKGSEVTFHFRPLAAGDCMKCHRDEFSRPFNWDNWWPPVAHGGEKAVTIEK